MLFSKKNISHSLIYLIFSCGSTFAACPTTMPLNQVYNGTADTFNASVDPATGKTTLDGHGTSQITATIKSWTYDSVNKTVNGSITYSGFFKPVDELVGNNTPTTSAFPFVLNTNTCRGSLTVPISGTAYSDTFRIYMTDSGNELMVMFYSTNDPNASYRTTQIRFRKP